MLTGTFSNGMPGSPFMVLQGDFQLFNHDPSAPDQANLTYDFDMMGTNGDIIHFNGKKLVNPSVTLNPLRTWGATSTLYVTLTRQSGSVVGKGVLHIKPADFVKELKTFTAVGPTTLTRLESARRFLSYFTGQVTRFFFAPFSALQWPAASCPQDSG